MRPELIGNCDDVLDRALEHDALAAEHHDAEDGALGVLEAAEDADPPDVHHGEHEEGEHAGQDVGGGGVGERGEAGRSREQGPVLGVHVEHLHLVQGVRGWGLWGADVNDDLF